MRFNKQRHRNHFRIVGGTISYQDTISMVKIIFLWSDCPKLGGDTRLLAPHFKFTVTM